MKVRKSQAYLVVSSAHLGMAADILAVYSNVAKHFRAKVIHLGPLALDTDIKRFVKLREAYADTEEMADNAMTERQGEKAAEKLNAIDEEIDGLREQQTDIFESLERHFGKVTFVTTKEMMIDDPTDADLVFGGLELSKYLFLSPVPPKTHKASSSAITARSVTYLKELGKSWIVAHPIPEVDCFAKPGLNEAHNYFTVGCLKHAKSPTHTSNQYEFAHMPCAIFVVVDKENDEFHAVPLHIDYLEKDRQSPAVIYDGLVFTTNGMIEVKSPDRATVGADYHAPFAHPGVVGAHRALNVLFQPYTLIDAGDGGSYESVSHWAEGKPGDNEGLRLKDDIVSHRRLLDAVTNVQSIKRKVMIDSNHPEWVTDYVSKHPALKGLCDWPALALDVFPDWEVMLREAGDNKILWFGDLAIRHGDKDGGAKKAEARIPSGKYLCGHFHKYIAWRRAVQMGCGARLGPKYVGNEINAWQSQLATLTKYNDIAAVGAKIILHDKTRSVSRFCYRDKIYEADAYQIP